MKSRYISLMNDTLYAYSVEHMLRYFDDVKKNGLKEHGFPRLTANIGILIAHGYRTELTDMFIEMMDFCCKNVPIVKAANDFSVKELIFCIMALEKNGGVSKECTERWRNDLATIEPKNCYTVYAKSADDELHNWALFTAVSEHMRKVIGLRDTTDFVDLQLITQLRNLDQNGMYRDPNNPMVYDLVPRGLFSVLLHFGYNGKYFSEIDEALKKAGLLTLKMQSVTGEIPYGGRSNQFMHNEAHLAIVFEFEAKRYAKEGNMALAGKFKLGVELALDNIAHWLSKKPMRHIKNRFPTETKYGCEEYAYFDKYMITTASFLYAASLICDESIPSAEEGEQKPYTLTLPEHFHKTFMAAGGYFLEFDTNADPHYDASGLGRVHKKGAPSTVCCSLACAKHPNTVLDVENASDISLCAGYVTENQSRFATDCRYEVTELCSDESSAHCTIKNTFDDGKILISSYGLDQNGVSVTVKGEGDVLYMLPAFVFDGEENTVIEPADRSLKISYKGYTCIYEADGVIFDTSLVGGNRNGHFRAFAAKGNGELNVRIRIEKSL